MSLISIFFSFSKWTVHGTEYGFGAHDYPSSGVFEVESKSCPGFIYRRTVWLGTTDMSQEEFRSFIEKLAGDYHGNTYHLINKNCNHFADDVSQNLTGKPIPSWVNRLARVGWYQRHWRYFCFLYTCNYRRLTVFSLKNFRLSFWLSSTRKRSSFSCRSCPNSSSNIWWVSTWILNCLLLSISVISIKCSNCIVST